VSPLPVAVLGLLLVLWGTVVGLDLASVLQGLLSRPLVAGAVAGWLVGDAEAGLKVGALLELFALDVLPVGASRYPEYGPAAVGAATVAATFPGPGGTGLGALVGLAVAVVGGWSLGWLRHANSRHVQRLAPELASGSVTAIRTLQWSGLARDAARSAGMTALGLILALGLWSLESAWVVTRLAPMLLPVLLGAGVAAAFSGALRTAGRGRRLAWLGAGLAVGAAIAVVRIA